ncbi:MAG: Fpg/Nei family DNA glycosylase [Fidelibacterota bacterium]
MPELPDLEGFKTYFTETSMEKTIENITSESPELIQNHSLKEFRNKLTGHRFSDIRRRGKFLIIEISSLEEKLLLHFAMTGNLHYVKQEESKEGNDRYTRLSFQFKNGYELRWLNKRKLGKIYLTKEPNKIDLINEMGPDPLELNYDEFKDLLELHSNKMLKSLLMDQSDIAGIGNVYSDEILYNAHLHPRRKVAKLSSEEKKDLFAKMQTVLDEACKIKRQGDEFSKDKWLIPHRNEDMQCPANKKHKLKSEKISGRTAIFCPKCQPG